ncbi:MAG: hypothetical protein AB1634_09535 [Thermodesulfobacteriota bacterium]
MDPSDITLHQFVDGSDPERCLAEIQAIMALAAPEALDLGLFVPVWQDVLRLFHGRFPGYRASNTLYHNLEHTCSVVLAMARLLHGLTLGGHPLSCRALLLGLYAALFHDTGLIQEEGDQEGSGAKYTVGHEERSIALMQRVLAGRGLPAADLEDCRHLIRATILSLSLREIPFRDREMALVGQAMGSADLLAQMADPRYLDKLPLLFKEFQEGGLSGYRSEQELVDKTEEFYYLVAQRRLHEELGGVFRFMRLHFRARWGVDRDLYSEAIEANMIHLRQIQDRCGTDSLCTLAELGRSHPDSDGG